MGPNDLISVLVDELTTLRPWTRRLQHLIRYIKEDRDTLIVAGAFRSLDSGPVMTIIATVGYSADASGGRGYSVVNSFFASDKHFEGNAARQQYARSTLKDLAFLYANADLKGDPEVMSWC